MDTAPRYEPRLRPNPYLTKPREAMPDDSGGESDAYTRGAPNRKFQRTAPDTTETLTFRKPSVPASANRPAGLEKRPSLSARRRSGVMNQRENVGARVPSGPREYAGSPGKRYALSHSWKDRHRGVRMKWWNTNITFSFRNASTTSSLAAPSLADSNTNLPQQRPFLPNSNSDSFFHGKNQHTQSRFSFGKPPTNESTPPTPADDQPRADERDLGFLPPVNFDDFHTSLAEYDGNGMAAGGLLNKFPNTPAVSRKPVGGDRNMNSTKGNGLPNARGAGQSDRQEEAQPVDRSSSFNRRRVSAFPNARQGDSKGLPQSNTTPNLSFRTRRQSVAPNAQNAGPPSNTAPQSGTTSSKQPRKSVGPGLITTMMGRSGQQPASTAPAEGATPARTSSLNRNRKTALNTSGANGHGTEAPRVSTLTANTASRAAKVKTLQPPSQDSEPNTPNARNSTKTGANRSHTPTSGAGSSSKRQSMAPPSGRASGLGARTVSPTDARRQKRLSMMQAPPVPTSSNQQQSQPAQHHSAQCTPQGPPTPQDDLSLAPRSATNSELPRLAQPSPSLIPRRTEMTPNSGRTSPEARHSFVGGVSLHKKSSQQSLSSPSASGFNGSQSRLPTPKTRTLHSAQGRADTSSDGDESVPPVPAIPKAYESPQETETKFFDSVTEQERSHTESSALPLPTSQTSGGLGTRQKRNTDLQSETLRKISGEYSQSHHGTAQPALNASATYKTSRQQKADPTATGRKNNSLQPLRLPPLNLLPMSDPAGPAQKRVSSVPKPTQELTQREEPISSTAAGVKTPEPTRRTTAKTPSTPMTASKASFFRRQDNGYNQKGNVRSASSHYALRDATEDMPEPGATRFFDTSDEEGTSSSGPDQKGVSIPTAASKQYREKRGITPFASGSLPKGGGEYARLRGRPSGDWDAPTDDYSLGGYQGLRLESAKPQGPRPRTTTTAVAVSGPQDQHDQEVSTPPQSSGEKKESTGSSLRRKLSLGWRRASSKNATHAENQPQSSPQEEKDEGQFYRQQQQQSQTTKKYSEMPPPKLPASATWSNDMGIPSLPSSNRPSLETARRKSTAAALHNANGSDATTPSADPPQTQSNAPRITKLHSEQPIPAPSTATTSTNRSTSWGNFTIPTTRTPKPPLNQNQQQQQPPPAIARSRQPNATPTAPTKDKDDLAADAEMLRLSQKRRDVDAAARETEALHQRAVPRPPLSPDQALADRHSHLNIFERGEITEYAETGVYFTGTKNSRKIIGSLNPDSGKTSSSAGGDTKEGNHGYDDERGDYNIVIGDHLAYRYEVIDVLGKGSFGQVVRCVDHKEGGIVAVKIIRNKKRFHQQALVEVGILGRLGGWDPHGHHATLSIIRSFYFRSHLCIVTPCLSINLYELIRAHNFTGFSVPLIRRFTRQLLSCLALLQTKRIIHCDLKPENILLCSARTADVRVIDFGSSCREEEKVYTYIQSRFYRSPEVILGSSYGLGIDVWSLGCILAELWTGYPLFPGENEQEQLACIMEIFGPPDRHLVDRCTRKKLFFDSVGKPRVTVSSKGRRRRPSSKTLSQALKCDDEAFVDFIARCLRWDPDRRLKASEAINHPFVTGQPMHTRGGGIPDEARRAARIRSTAAAGISNIASTGGVPSPVKRVQTTGTNPVNAPSTTTAANTRQLAGNAFAQQAATASASASAANNTTEVATTPVKPKRTATTDSTGPGTPQTVVRNATTTAGGSPAKPALGSRRQSAFTSSSTSDNAGPIPTWASAGTRPGMGAKRGSNGNVLTSTNSYSGGNGNTDAGQTYTRQPSFNSLQSNSNPASATPNSAFAGQNGSGLSGTGQGGIGASGGAAASAARLAQLAAAQATSSASAAAGGTVGYGQGAGFGRGRRG
ncbi:hypothetical protein MBLNU230_g6675t1 [Neophaeotheca triangularis]